MDRGVNTFVYGDHSISSSVLRLHKPALVREEWNEIMNDLVYWTGASGCNRVMNLCSYGLPFYPTGGVYIFCKPTPGLSGRWLPIYVGETENFNDRLNANLLKHHRWNCIQRHGATKVCVVDIAGGKAIRVAVETDLRKSLDPICNRQ